MKKLFTLSSLFVLFMGFNSFAQSVRLVLAEEFTQASCPPCATQNPAFNTLLNANTAKVCQIKYQTSWPGVDPMNDQTDGWVAPRVAYYGVTGVPTATMDGQEQRGSSYCGAPANWNATKITNRQNVSSKYDLTVTHSFNASMDSMHIVVTATATVADTGVLNLHLAIIERDIPFCSEPGTNGEIVFEGVMRAMIPDANGTPIDSIWAVGQTHTYNFDIKIPDYVYDKSTLGVVSFIQDNTVFATTTISAPALNSTTITVGSAAGIAVGMYISGGQGIGNGRFITAISGNTLTLGSNTSTTTTVSGTAKCYFKDVRQAAYSVPQPIANDAKIDCDGVDVPVISCGNPITPVITFKNMGTSALTALNLDYKIDGVSQTAIPWTGSVASGATGTVSIPSANLASSVGTHYIQVNVTNPNNSSDFNVYYDSSTVSYHVVPSVGAAAPLTQAFTAAAFPPANWNIINNGGPLTWARANASLGGAGSAKIDFYDIAAGDVDDLVLPSYDFSDPAVTSVTLEFDQAYAQYNTSSSDRLQVMYSVDCGQNWTSVYNKAGVTLASGNAATTTAFTPSSTTQWHHETVTLNNAVGNNNVFIAFRGTSNYGNNAYVDNINLNTNLTTSVGNLFTDREVSVYPNPSQGRFNVKMNFDNGQDVTITVTNALGAVVKTVKIPNVTSELIPVDLTGAAKGSYEVSVKSATKLVTKRITITE